MFDEGANVGPELTGSDRANLDYVLENVLDPSASVPVEYRLSDGGHARWPGPLGDDPAAGRQDAGRPDDQRRVVLAREDVAELKASNQSMMPEGLFERLTDDEVRDLVAYLASKVQVPPAAPKPLTIARSRIS